MQSDDAELLVSHVTSSKIKFLAIHQNEGYDRRLLYKQPRQDLGLYSLSFACYSESVSPKFRELCVGEPCWFRSEGHQHGGFQVAETSVFAFFY